MSQDALQQFSRDLRAYLKTVPRVLGQTVVQESAENFRRQGYENEAGAVVPWEPRQAADTVKRRGKRIANPRQRAILVKSGRLRRSVRIVATTATSVTVGTDVPYAEAQQEGNGRLPARPFITLGRAAKEKLIKKIAARITGFLSK